MTLVKSKKITSFIFFLILISIISSFILIKNNNLVTDEATHYDQIIRFVNNDFALNPHLTTIPGYHAVVAVIAYIFRIPSVGGIRLISLIFSVFSILVFFFLSERLHKERSIIKTVQYCYFPILFPFFFLIYTDIFSLLLVLVSLYFLITKRYNLAGIIGILGFLVRQNNIVWLGFMCVFVFYEKYNFKFEIEVIKNYLKDIWIFIMGFIIFIVFVIINKGNFAIGDQIKHPPFSLYLGNIYFLLFLFFFLFLPLNISNLPNIIKLIRKNKKIILLVVLIFAIYIFTFVNNHPYNTQWYDYFLRNKLLVFFTSTILLKILFFIPVAYSILSLCVTKLKNKSYYLLYPFTFLFLIPSWLIEQRYYLIPLSFFILFKKERYKLVEYLTIIIYILVSLVFFYGIRNFKFFL